MKVAKIPLSQLKQPERNMRIHSEKQLQEFERSIVMFGQIRPLVVDENNVVLAGNGCFQTLVRMGAETAEVYKIDRLSESQKKKLMIADNRIFDLGIDDLDTFNSFLEELRGDLDIPGYDESLLESMVAEAEEVIFSNGLPVYMSFSGGKDSLVLAHLTLTLIQQRQIDTAQLVVAPLNSLQWVDRSLLKPNDYNPNKVSKENLKLLTQSILTNGWTLPIVVRPDYTIIDGFHRWMVSGREPLKTHLKNKVPIVMVVHKDESEDIYGTITHNRARGTHLLEPMKTIVKRLMSDGKSVEEIGKQLGMKPEEIFRLSDFSKEDFLEMMIKGKDGYGKAEILRDI